MLVAAGLGSSDDSPEKKAIMNKSNSSNWTVIFISQRMTSQGMIPIMVTKKVACCLPVEI